MTLKEVGASQLASAASNNVGTPPNEFALAIGHQRDELARPHVR